MNCKEFEKRFHELADDRVSPHQDVALQQHATECHDCAELLCGWQQVELALNFQDQSVLPTKPSVPRGGTRMIQVLASIAANIVLGRYLFGSKAQ